MSDTSLGQPRYDIGTAIGRVFNLPGRLSLLFRVVLSASLILLLLYVLFGRGIIESYMEMIKTIIELESSDPEDPEAAMAMMGQVFAMMGSMMIIGLGSWMTMVSAETAMHKNTFFGTDAGLFPLRFGVAELRVALAQFIVYLIVSGVYMGGYFIFIIFAMLAAFGAETNVALGVVMGILAFAALVAWIGAMALAYVRLSPTAAMSVRDNEIRTVEGWKISKGYFWPMFGSYIVIWIVGSIAMIIPVLAMLGLLAGPMTKLFNNDNLEGAEVEEVFSQFGAIFDQPHIIVGLLIIGLILSIVSMIYKLAIWGVGNYMADIDRANTDEDIFA